MNAATGGTEYRGDGIDIAPQSIDHMLKFMGGGVLQFGLRWQNLAAKAIDGKEIEKRDIPFARRFYKSLNPKQTISDFYDDKDTLAKYQADYVGLRGAARVEYNREYKDYLLLQRYSSGIEKALRQLNKQKRIIDSSELSQKDKDHKLTIINDKKIDLTMRFSQKKISLGIKHI